DPEISVTVGDSPAAVGNRIAARVLAWGFDDSGDEAYNYADNTGYEPVNDPLQVELRGTEMNDPNRWQPLALETFVSQNGIPIPQKVQTFTGPHWGAVTPFALVMDNPEDPYIWSHVDPGPPPQLGGEGDARFKAANAQVIQFSGWLDPDDGAMIDISPASMGSNPLGTNDGTGYDLNPITGEPYEPNMVKRGDFGRILAEFWADGPDSETPPGHWNTLANYVSDHPDVVKRFEGVGPVLDDLEWDVKLYLAINGAVHDSAVAAWGAKAAYDYVRPISSIRYMGGLGQSTDPNGPSFHPDGLPLIPGSIEVITEETIQQGGRHHHLVEPAAPGMATDEHVGDIAIYAWRGIPEDPENEYSGAGWILAEDWVPYQRNTFVTPPFAGYVSGHSTFSRSAAEVLTRFTGSKYFPGGLGELVAPMDDFLEFEIGPTEEVTLQWATYQDASDQAGISRLWGGIHVEADDFGGRIMGYTIGQDAFALAKKYFTGEIEAELTPSPTPTATATATATQTPRPEAASHPEFDASGNGFIDAEDLLVFLQNWHRTTQ
ncbi:MAG: vanadium-dependent haloperoxidase, partial [Candidatus Omnitrophica bacterium]|nr:vanadium-dependent haloperoxidase [Candidatus Omnitrophota bacterium]